MSTSRADFVETLSLAERVVYGIDVGIDTNTAADYLCLACHKKKQYATMFDVESVYYCPTHHKTEGRSYRHKSKFPEYRERYNQELEHRLEQEKTMTQAEERQLTVRPPVLPSKVDKGEMISTILNAGLVTTDDFGPFTAMAQEYLAVVALIHGLDPHLGEVQVWANKKWDGNLKEYVPTGVVTFISGYGYLRKAEEREQVGDGYTWAEDDGYRLTPQEVKSRMAHICSQCNGSGKFASSNNNCKYCEGKGEFDPQDVIVIKRSLYLQRQAKVAKNIGVPPKAINGYGVIQPWDYNIARGRDLIARAELRGLKAVLKNAYQISFWIPEATADLLDNYVAGEHTVEENGDVIEGTARVIDEEPAEWPDHEEPEVAEEPMAEEEPTEQPELVTLKQLGHNETIPKNQQGIELQSYIWRRLGELGYQKGAPQNNLLKALWGDGVDWKTITGIQIWNTLAYANRAYEQPKDVKDALKDECRKKTEAGEFWT